MCPGKLRFVQDQGTRQLFEKLYGIHYIIPENATFATAIGAGLYSLKKRPET